MVVLGVVAAVTVPMFIHQEGDRVNSERHANIVYKIAQATDMMKAHGNLGKFASTDEFVDELQKYLKINKRCDSNHLDECWTTSKVKTMSGKEYDVKNAKTRKDLLGDEINHPDNPNVGIVLADGANIILTYNPDSEGMAQGDEVMHKSGLLPVGNGREEFLNYSSDTMGAMAFVFDVNGNRGSNSEKQGNIYKDIRSFNGARFIPTSELDPCNSSTDPCCKYEFDRKISVGNTCYFELPKKYNWAGAKTACQNTVSGATLYGSKSQLLSLCQSLGSTAPFSSNWYFWSTSPYDGWNSSYHDGAWVVLFTRCGSDDYLHANDSNYVLCAGQ